MRQCSGSGALVPCLRYFRGQALLPLPLAVPVEVVVDSGSARGAASGGAVSGGAEPASAEPGGVEPEGAEPWGADSEGAELGGTEPGGAKPGGAESKGEEFGGADPRAGGSAAGGTRAGGAGAGDPGAREPGAGSAGAGGPGAGGTVQRHPFFVPPQQSSLPPIYSVLRQSKPQLLPDSPLPAPSPYAEQTESLRETREPESRLASLVSALRAVCIGRHVPRPRPPLVPGTHIMALRPSSVPLRVPLPSPPASSLPDVPDPESYLARAASPTIPRLLATVVTGPSFESSAVSALVAELVDFAAACRLDYATSLVAESESDCPPSIGGESALGSDVLEDKQEGFECLAAAVPYLVAMLLEPDAPDIPTPRSYTETITGLSVRRVLRLSSRLVKLLEEFFQTFSPTLKMTTLWVLLHVAAQRDYELHSLDFSTAFLQGSQHEEIWLCRPPGFTGSFSAGTQWSLRRPVYGLCQAPCEWHDTLRTTLAALGFAPSTADPSMFLRTDTLLPPFCFLVYVDDLVFATADTEALTLVKLELQKRHTCTDLGELCSYLGLQITLDRARHTITLIQSHMVHQSIKPSGPYPELVGCLITSDMGLVLGGRGLVFLTGHADASWVDDLATQRSSQSYTFSLGSGSVSWRSTRLSSVLRSSCEAEIYAGAMAAQELRWLTYLLTNLGERPRSSPVLYVDNKAMTAYFASLAHYVTLLVL
ncbi:unnamed protein product [Closterium sp. NIES-53]